MINAYTEKEIKRCRDCHNFIYNGINARYHECECSNLHIDPDKSHDEIHPECPLNKDTAKKDEIITISKQEYDAAIKEAYMDGYRAGWDDGYDKEAYLDEERFKEWNA